MPNKCDHCLIHNNPIHKFYNNFSIFEEIIFPIKQIHLFKNIF